MTVEGRQSKGQGDNARASDEVKVRGKAEGGRVHEDKYFFYLDSNGLSNAHC